MNERENWLRAWRFQGPDHIPIAVGIPPAMWRFYGRDLEDVVARHPLLFPHFRKGSVDYDRLPIDPRNKAGTVFVDPWGCVYKPAEVDVPSYVAEHPLEDDARVRLVRIGGCRRPPRDAVRVDAAIAVVAVADQVHSKI
jgi:hypothetical protein